ncbi:hypothetical protein LE181_26060 [Streptomyces sp. SCA3-4]|uniref:hypothetical protein n=1 Tax=Streptomyces sichuanensis TaxID=2871810 RepID=UPI001CE2D0FD|nr:hypothetical protein [Streptomyces sichuanensis]MCA6095612.1 hypothetical protein [Streptomyces sichuanensis]
MINRRTFGKVFGLGAGGAVAATLVGPSGPAHATAVTEQQAAAAAAPEAGARPRRHRQPLAPATEHAWWYARAVIDADRL